MDCYHPETTRRETGRCVWVTFYITEKDWGKAMKGRGNELSPQKGTRQGYRIRLSGWKKINLSKKLATTRWKVEKVEISAVCEVTWRNLARDIRALADTVNAHTHWMLFLYFSITLCVSYTIYVIEEELIDEKIFSTAILIYIIKWNFNVN